MPITGIDYWLFGNGIARNVNVHSLDLHMVASDFGPIKAMLADASKGTGTYPVNGPFEYNTFAHSADLAAAGLMGRVNGNVSGVLLINADGTYAFNGAYSLNEDVYDAPTSNRTWGQEALTTFLRGLGDVLGHNGSTIRFLGQQEVQFTGSRN